MARIRMPIDVVRATSRSRKAADLSGSSSQHLRDGFRQLIAARRVVYLATSWLDRRRIGESHVFIGT